MEKIQTIEQLDKVGVKICEMLNVSIDKASVILPETFQQFIYFTIASLKLLIVQTSAFFDASLRLKAKELFPANTTTYSPATLMFLTALVKPVLSFNVFRVVSSYSKTSLLLVA